VALAEAHDLARLVWNGEVVAERRPPVLRFGAATVPLPPGAFLQATQRARRRFWRP
jgi:23S rRNA (uracil1939-C5)-methyltransferase